MTNFGDEALDSSAVDALSAGAGTGRGFTLGP
jgi:hypothetical protein